MFQSPGAILLTFGSIKIYWYGFIMAIAVLSAILIATKIKDKFYPGIDKDVFFNLLILSLIGGMIGARIYYVLINYSYYFRHFSEIFMIMNGGLSIHGALIGGFFAGAIYAKIKKISILQSADIVAYALPVAQAIGRWGNFFNSEAFGLPTDLPWKLYIAPQFRHIQYFEEAFFHPTFLYESILNILIFLILFFWVRKFKRRKDGFVFCAYLILYSFCRFFIEALRIDGTCFILNMPVASFVSLLLLATGIFLTVFISFSKS